MNTNIKDEGKDQNNNVKIFSKTGYGYDGPLNHFDISDEPVKIVNGIPTIEIDNDIRR